MSERRPAGADECAGAQSPADADSPGPHQSVCGQGQGCRDRHNWPPPLFVHPFPLLSLLALLPHVPLHISEPGSPIVHIHRQTSVRTSDVNSTLVVHLHTVRREVGLTLELSPVGFPSVLTGASSLSFPGKLEKDPASGPLSEVSCSQLQRMWVCYSIFWFRRLLPFLCIIWLLR